MPIWPGLISPIYPGLTPLPPNSGEGENEEGILINLESIEGIEYHPWNSPLNPPYSFYSDTTEATNRKITTFMPTGSMDFLNEYYHKRHLAGFDDPDGRLYLTLEADDVSSRTGLAFKEEKVTWSYGGFVQVGPHTPIPQPLSLEQSLIWNGGLRGITPALPQGVSDHNLLLFGNSPGTLFNMAQEVAGFVGKELYEYYSFSTMAPYVKDVYTHGSDFFRSSQDTETGRPMMAIADISPVYNFYKEDYEIAITPDNVPEAILPNLYVYGLLEATQIGGRFPSLSRARTATSSQWNWQQNQLDRGYDKIVTLNEFEWNIFPRLGDPLFLDYLTAYAGSVPNVAVDTRLSLAQEVHNIGTPASDIGLYNKYNLHKTSFPMYIETDIPTVAMGKFGRALAKSATSTRFINSLLMTEPNRPALQVNSTGFDLPGGPDSTVYISSFLNLTNSTISRATEVYDFDRWISNLSEAIRLTILTEGGEDVGNCPDPLTELMITNIKNLAKEEGNRFYLSYGDILRGQRMCRSETIIYKLKKIAVATPDTAEKEIQNFYFPNVEKDDVIRYVDTQVKYNKMYRYELYGYSLVYGSEIFLSLLELPRSWEAVEGEPLSIQITSQSTPKLKVIEYPIFARSWLDANLAGVCYPDVIIQDRPPIAPEVQIYPFRKDYRAVMMNFQAGIGSYIGEEALKYIPLSDDDATFMAYQSHEQRRLLNYSLPPGHLEFRNEGYEEIKEIEIFRTTEINKNPVDEMDLYRSFAGTLTKVLRLVSGEEERELLEEAALTDRSALTEYVEGLDFEDDIALNVPYYYTFRAVDMHGNFSNPSSIFRVELQYDRGLYIPYITSYAPQYPAQKSPSMKFDRFIEIGAAFLQTEVFDDYDEDGNLTDQSKGLLGSSTPENRFSNNEYLVRITSRDTGRKIDLKIDFNESERLEDT